MDDSPGPAAAHGSDLYLYIESRLETLFVQYSNAEISKEAFREKVLNELKVTRQQIDNIRKMRAVGTISEADSKLRLNQGRDALAAARWCLEWADGLHMDDQSSLSHPSGPGKST